MSIESDSFPRISVRDLFIVLSEFERQDQTKLENIRLRMCVDRQKPSRGTSQYSVARDNTGELVKLGYAEGACLAKNSAQFQSMRDNLIRVNEAGRKLLRTFKEDRGAAYDELLKRMVEQHSYLRQFVIVINRGELFAPVISSMKEHLSPKYTANAMLASDIAEGEFDFDGFFAILTSRLGRNLVDGEKTEIQSAMDELISASRPSAVSDETVKFAKNFLNKINYIVVPALFRKFGLGFDYRTHRAIWEMGQDFRVCATLSSHPSFDGSVVYLTSKLDLDETGSRVALLEFTHGLKQVGENFLPKLHVAYQELQSRSNSTFVPAWELRSIFCFDNKCQPTVFDRLFDQSYSGSDEYQLHLELQRQKPQHETALRAGNRNIGSVRVSKR